MTRILISRVDDIDWGARRDRQEIVNETINHVVTIFLQTDEKARKRTAILINRLGTERAGGQAGIGMMCLCRILVAPKLDVPLPTQTRGTREVRGITLPSTKFG